MAEREGLNEHRGTNYRYHMRNYYFVGVDGAQKMNTCCKKCVRRYPGCHAECEDYMEFRAEKDSMNAKRREANEGEWDIDSYILHIRERIRKGRFR